MSKLEGYLQKKKEFQEMEEKVKNYSSPIVPPNELPTLKELMNLCLDVQRKALEQERKELGLE